MMVLVLVMLIDRRSWCSRVLLKMSSRGHVSASCLSRVIQLLKNKKAIVIRILDDVTSWTLRCPERCAHRAVTDVLGVRGSDGRLHIRVVQETVRQHDVKRQPSTSTQAERKTKEA